MKLNLPKLFVDKMKLLLGEEYERFLASYNEERFYGLRINELKINAATWLEQTDMKPYLQQIPWCANAFYYTDDVRPAKHPHYHAGLYYIQEPSAMVPVELLDVKPGHRVLDLCAAPGGKSTQIASKLQGEGILITNDIATERTKPLAKNIELAGVRNAVVLNEHPANIAQKFGDWFDRILIDAPCSGEGMFRKSPSMVEEWESYSVERCSTMQREILDEVAQMLAPGGRMVYSTCTFSPEENEEQIARFIARHPDFSVVPIEPRWGWASGNPQWVSSEAGAELSKEQLLSIARTVRLWPHRTKGEGHFVAVLMRQGQPSDRPQSVEPTQLSIDWSGITMQDHKTYDKVKGKAKPKGKPVKVKGAKVEELDCESIWQQFQLENVQLTGNGQLRAVMFGSRVYLQPEELPSLEGLKVIRAGWLIGEMKRNKFAPFHPLAMALRPREAARVLSLSADDEQLLRYLRGETIFVEEQQLQFNASVKKNGYVLICVDQFPVGFGKYLDGMIKNELPAGWRMM